MRRWNAQNIFLNTRKIVISLQEYGIVQEAYSI